VDYFFAATLEVVSGIASLMLISIGLAIVFGMMRVINLAHGEFLMLGAYSTITAVKFGFNVWIAILVVAPAVVGVIGLIVERLIIRHLYGRIIATMLATWGLSLLIIGLATTIFGNTTAGISSPLGSVEIGSVNVNGYNFFIIAVAAATFALIYFVFKRTSFGLLARATMQSPEMASAMGINPKRIYALTFAIGAALGGLAGGVLAPISAVVPTVGTAYVAKAFLTVIAGGASVLVGTLSASVIFGTANLVASFLWTPVIGEVTLLCAALVIVRLLPQGITGHYFRGSV